MRQQILQQRIDSRRLLLTLRILDEDCGGDPEQDEQIVRHGVDDSARCRRGGDRLDRNGSGQRGSRCGSDYLILIFHGFTLDVSFEACD